MNKYEISRLSNGIQLITVPLKGAATASALVMVKTGSKYEDRATNGLSHFLEHMFFKGTEKYPDTLALSSAMDALGGEYNAFTSKEYTGYWTKVAAPKLGQALDIMGDMLLRSRFDAAEIDRERGVIIEEINMYEDNPLMHIEDVFESCLYGDSPAGWETIGPKENIKNFKRKDFLDYLKRQYGARSIYVILAGNISAADKKAAGQMFAGFKKNSWRKSVPTPDRQTTPRVLGAYKKIDQTNLSLGVRAFPIGHPEEFSAKLLAVVLGGSMSSRLFINLRERNGLAYYVRTMAENYSDAGYLTTQAGVPRRKTAEAIKIIMDEYRRIASQPVPAAELKRAKDMLQGKSLLQLESTDSLANWYGRQAVLRGKMLTPAESLRRIKAVTAEEMLRTAKKIFVNRNLNLALIGADQADRFRGLLKF